MIPAALLLLAAQTLALPPPRSCACPCAQPVDKPNHPFRRPGAAAFELNRQGRDHYRARRWTEAEAKYSAALQADPSFLAPRLNIACALAQQERFRQAVQEATALAEAEFVPWGRAIREAADLAPLKAHPEGQVLEDALAAAGRRWGAGLQGAVLFLARREPPVQLPPAGVLYLGLGQEILAWLPGSGTYRQVTAEEGRVLGFFVSPDERSVFYVRAGRLVREPGREPRLRALSLRKLDLNAMALGPEVPVGVDLLVLEMDRGPSASTVRLRFEAGDRTSWHLFDGLTLSPAPAGAGHRSSVPGLRLTARGVETRTRAPHGQPCRLSAEDTRVEGVPAVRIRAPARRPFLLEGPFGAGLRGLPFP